MSTEEKIVAKALEMFNERGIEYVGLREIAATLDMRVSNITYYFPTKDDLVNQISLDLGKLNSDTITVTESISLQNFFETIRQVFSNHVKYRCLLLSFVHLMEQNKVMSARYQKVQKNRKDTIKLNIEKLSKSGYLKVEGNDDIEFLVSTITLISRFWISEAAISFRHLDTDNQIHHYLRLIAKIFLPYSTAKGKKEIQALIVRTTATQKE